MLNNLPQFILLLVISTFSLIHFDCFGMDILKLPTEVLLLIVGFLIPAKTPLDSHRALCSARLTCRTLSPSFLFFILLNSSNHQNLEAFNSAVLQVSLAIVDEAAAGYQKSRMTHRHPILGHLMWLVPALLLEKIKRGEGEHHPLVNAICGTTEYILDTVGSPRKEVAGKNNIRTLRHSYWRDLCLAAGKGRDAEELLHELWTGEYDEHDAYTGALVAAVVGNDLALLRALLEKEDGGDINKCWPFANPLSTAIMIENKSAVRMLLDSGKNIAGVEMDSEEPYLTLAGILYKDISHGDGEVFRTLLSRYPNVLLEWEDERTFLSLAAEHGNKEIVKCLLEPKQQKQNDRWPDDTRMTPVEYAAQRGHVEIVKMLIERNHAVRCGSDP